MITILNLRECKPTEPFHVRVDRGSGLGNPFYMRNESERDEVCNKYEEWFNEHCNDPEIKGKLDDLASIYKQHGQIILFCWCAPKRCHAETIKKYLSQYNKKE